MLALVVKSSRFEVSLTGQCLALGQGRCISPKVANGREGAAVLWLRYLTYFVLDLLESSTIKYLYLDSIAIPGAWVPASITHSLLII